MKLKTYSLWEHPKDHTFTMVEGEDIPRFVNGTPQHTQNKFILLFQAKDWEDAMEQYNRYFNNLR